MELSQPFLYFFSSERQAEDLDCFPEPKPSCFKRFSNLLPFYHNVQKMTFGLGRLSQGFQSSFKTLLQAKNELVPSLIVISLKTMKPTESMIRTNESWLNIDA